MSKTENKPSHHLHSFRLNLSLHTVVNNPSELSAQYIFPKRKTYTYCKEEHETLVACFTIWTLKPSTYGKFSN